MYAVKRHVSFYRVWSLYLMLIIEPRVSDRRGRC